MKSRYKPLKRPMYEVYAFTPYGGEKYMTGYLDLKDAVEYCKRNYPVKYYIKKVIGTVNA